jgi:DNA polymerase II small subunit
MVQNILKLFIEKGFLLDKEMLDFLLELKDEEVANEILNKIAVISKQKLITRNLVSKNFEKIKSILYELDRDKKTIVEKFFVNVSVSIEVKKETSVSGLVIESRKDLFKEEAENNVKILSSPIMASKKLEVKDFVRYFRCRYNLLKNFLQQNSKLENLTSIDKIGGNNRIFSIIGIVTNKTITKNKNLVLEVEDLTGSTKLLINQNKEEIYKKSKEILLDDVLGFRCSGSRDFLYVNDFFYPDCFLKEKHRTSEDVYALFISDIHVGSNNFLEKNFEKFIMWLNGKDCDEKQKQILKKIRYMFVVGDNIDGVGVYPGQEKCLKIKDIKEQYKKLAEYYKRIPSYINIIQCAGQHDAVRVAEPQPPVGEDFAEPLHKIENLYLVSNPSLVEISGKKDRPGIKVLMYHGASMHPIINEIEELRLGNASRSPAKVVKHMLLRRHLAPIHGNMVYIPNANEDCLVIKEVPDIITTGDMHRTDIDKYNGVLIICNSCWQSVTAFEEKVGNVPDPCKVPLFNLKTGEIKILDFSDDEEEIKERECKEVSNNKEGKEVVCEEKNEK